MSPRTTAHLRESAMHNVKAVDRNARYGVASSHLFAVPPPPPTNAPPKIPTNTRSYATAERRLWKYSRGREPAVMRTTSSHVRSSSAPPTSKHISASRTTSRNPASTKGSSHGAGTCSKKDTRRRSFDDHARHRSMAAISVRSAPQIVEDMSTRRWRTGAVAKPSSSKVPTRALAKDKRPHWEETTRMQIDNASLIPECLAFRKGNTVSRSRSSQPPRVNLPPRLSFIEKDLPGTPNMLPRTPTELLPRTPTTPKDPELLKSRRSGIIGRSPLSQVSLNHGQAKDTGDPVLHASGLNAISEDSINNENMPAGVSPAIPTATQIHLRGGSVVTVTPPELTAWRRTCYLHGPIKLPKPAIAPRKNSVASLEAFQDVVDDLYQHSLAIPRRESDDAVSEDICDFFDDFGFDPVSFGGDILAKPVVQLDMVHEEEDESDVEASPIEVVIAKEVLESMNRLRSDNAPTVLKPLETSETLRARGIARLSRASAKSATSDNAKGRKESFSAGRPERVLQSILLPTPEAGDFGSGSPRLQPSRNASGTASMRPTPIITDRVLDEDDIQEMSVTPAWVSPAAAPKTSLSKGMSTRRPRNPLDRIRRVVATASNR
ncbi:hypothetical protein CB0940_01725 [Cercospora beticola]|uniref:Uncharacterized protein n=2 Tax=Cercospora beticola TaxID=122368 RepID=A0A2G5I6T9_CERBT|nr:hypothetical protein CB0940_01725 [Cercospora beticola]PIB00517.1 hypothetical protein CB0940_01725 [Cercospora beticola]CAK1354424.1 unnamed protein product [Cercospora beticola]